MNLARDFVHLHVHSHYSLLDGAITVPALVEAARSNGMTALALTDHGNLFGAIQFYRKCREAGVKPILGMEAYVAPGSRFDKKRTAGGAFFHFTLLARNAEGYHNLLQLTSRSYLEGFYYRPRIDRDLLREHSKGLIGMSACLSSEINRAAVQGTEAELRAQIDAYRSIFEPGCFFLELQRNGLAEQERVIARVPPVAREMGIPLVATNDIHYLRREDARAQEVHLCINTGQTMDDADRMRFGSEQFYFRSGAEMERVLGDFPEALANTRAVADLVNLELDFSSTHLPRFVAEGIDDHSAYLGVLCEDGLRSRYPNADRDPEIRKRLEYELSVIQKTGYVSYFLIVWDFIRFAREAGVPVGPGRGSAAGSLVAYALGITDVDPLRYDLLFERFLNADRVSMPDIDIDFCMDKRSLVIDYVKDKYGADRVCQIITFGTMAARAVIRDVGRVLGLPLSLVDSIAKKIPAGPGVELADALEGDGDLKALAASDPRVKELFDLSLRLEGLNRHASTHAAGVVIGDAPLMELVPLYKNGEEITTQFSMEDLEACGLLKMDFLGLRNLTVIDRAVGMLERSRGLKIDIRAIPLDDSATYELLCRGETTGVFQLESGGMRDLLRRLRPDRFEDVIAILALYRPGPLGSGMVDSYIKCKHGQEKIAYEHPLLEPILMETNGVILYQEQVMRIANQLAGFSLTEADSLRKAMGKKKPAIMAKFQSKFVEGAAARGVEGKIAERIWDLMVFFAGYGFNKSHSTAYAIVSYQTAYLKANYATEFMAALMTCEMSNTDKLAEYLEECRRLGIEILPPDVNHSLQGFSTATVSSPPVPPEGAGASLRARAVPSAVPPPNCPPKGTLASLQSRASPAAAPSPHSPPEGAGASLRARASPAAVVSPPVPPEGAVASLRARAVPTAGAVASRANGSGTGTGTGAGTAGAGKHTATGTSAGSLPRKIWYGIEAIKGIGAKAVLAILAARERNGPFRSLFDLCERVEASSLNKTVLDSLIASGALDCFGQRRAQLAAVAEAALGRGARSQEDQQSGQRTLFDLFDSSAAGGEASTGRTEPKADGAYPDVPEWSEAERLLREKQTLGFYLSGHPLHAQKTLIQKFATHTLGRIPGLANGTSVCVGVLIAKLTKKVSKKNGEPFWIALVEDLEGSMEIFVSTQLHDASREWLVEERLVFLKGSVRFRDTNVSISVDEIVPLEEAPAKLTTDLSVVIPIHDGPQAEDAIFRLKGVLGGHRGSCPVFLVLRNGKGEIVVQVGRENYVAPGPGLLAEVETICGPDGYFVNRMQGR